LTLCWLAIYGVDSFAVRFMVELVFVILSVSLSILLGAIAIAFLFPHLKSSDYRVKK
jgi:hypothetical protein